MKILLPIFLLILSSLTACATNPVTGQQDLVLLSENDEIALGRQTNKEVLQQYKVYDNPQLQQYVQNVGTQLAEKSHRNNLVYRFTVLDSKDVNAFALPGGYIYITRGLMAYLKSEAELAAVLGHEIGHVTARHSVRQYSANQLAGIGAAISAIFIPGMNQASNQLVQLFGTALLRGYGRDHELEADRLGAEYLARNNYDPNAMLDVISVLKNQETFELELAKAEGREPRIYHGVFSTHPDNDTRLQEVVATAKQLSNDSNQNRTNHEVYMNSIDNMVYGDSSHDGILRGNSFFHEDLGFALSFPSSWNVANRPEQIVATAPDGLALIQVGVEDINKKLSPRDFMLQRLGLKQLQQEIANSINGMPAHSAISEINTSSGARLARITVIYLNQMAYIIAGTSKEAKDLNRFDAAILNTAKSFHQMTEQEHVMAKPLRLKVIQAQDSTNFQSLAKNSPIESQAESQLRLLNAKYPNGNLHNGELIKVVE